MSKKKYLIAGKSDTCLDYARKKIDKKYYCQILNRKNISSIDSNSQIILLPGWWMREWFVDYYKDLVSSDSVDFDLIFEDGHAGQEFRDKMVKNLKSDSIKDRFEILDI